MKTVKIAIIFFSLIFASSAFAQSFKIGSEPNGFRNVNWGAELPTLSGMEYYKTSTAGGSYPVDQLDLFKEIYLDIYLKAGDQLRIEGAEVERIEYGFWKGKFCEVTIATKGFKNWASLKKAILGKFGEGEAGKFPSCVALGFGGFREEGFGEIEWHIWLGKIAEMVLQYNECSQNGELWMGSTILREQAFKEVEQERRGGKK
jgi:hypothetical protein